MTRRAGIGVTGFREKSGRLLDDGGVRPVVLDYKGAASVRDVYATGFWQALGTPSTI